MIILRITDFVKEFSGFFFSARKECKDKCLEDGPKALLERDIMRVVQVEKGWLLGENVNVW